MIWFTADTHFGHLGILKSRPCFDSVEEMDETIIVKYNALVKPSDTIYHLGDFSFGKAEDVKRYRSRLRGKIHLILGNHDYKNHVKQCKHLFSSVNDLFTLKWNKQKFILCHYAMRTWDSSHYGSYQVHGHSHGNLVPIGKQMDVGVDNWNFYPISIEQVCRAMLLKEDTPVIDHHQKENNYE